ncbi:caspase family protein [Rhodobacteraceae bacterium CCMM004]|nr:caspase family protein [Rhodobacteraceae bacterium CCMM004]
MLRALICAAALALPLAWAAQAREGHALLIGASTYDNLDPRFWLKGPANDVTLVRDYLVGTPGLPFASERVQVLADGVDGAAPPTLETIRGAMADLADRVAPGDFVYLHFSGHGSQAPAADPGSELDGLDELFLPVDIGPWNDTVGTVENALVDDEIGRMLDALRAKGADVWVVFDSCHSGTATRAAPAEDVRLRQLPPEALGVSAEALIAAEVAQPAPAGPTDRPPAPVELDPDSAGSLVAFFAAQTNEVTPEKNMPRGVAGRRPQGVFTYTLFETLAERPGITYRQLAQEVLRKYSAENLARSTPLFEGALDGGVFGLTPGARVAQWPAVATATGLRIPAGTLHGLAPGSELVALASPADPLEAALGRVTVTGGTAFDSVTTALPDLPGGVWLRRADAVIDFTLDVALPAGRSAPARRLLAAAQILRSEGLAGPRINFVAETAEADVRLAVLPESSRPDAIWVLPSSGLIDPEALAETPSISTGDKSDYQLADTLADTLSKMAKALNLLKIGGIGDAASLGVTAAIRAGRFDPETSEVVRDSHQTVEASAVPLLVPDDVVGLRLENGGAEPVDFNILYVGADYSISFIDNGRLQPGSVLEEDFVLIVDGAFGRDRMIVVLTPAAPQSAVEDLSFLEQPPLERTRAAGGGGPDGFAGLLDEAGFGQTTRGAVSLSSRRKEAPPAPAFLQFEFDTAPSR